jgi:hypothetical protein
MELTIGLKSILGWERLPLFGRYGYVEMIKCLMIKTLLFCRLSTELLVHSVCAHLTRSRPLYGGLCTTGSYGEGYFFPNMDGHIAYGLVLLARRYYN